MSCPLVRVALGLVLVAGMVSAAEARTWTNYQGKQIEAEYVRLDGQDVVLLMNGREFSVPLTQLSDPDKQFVFEQIAGAGASGANPFIPAPSPEGSEQSDDSASHRESDEDNEAASSDAASKGVARIREWTDDQGNRIRAKFIRIHEGNAILMQGRKTVPCPLEKLSSADQEYLRELLEARGEGHLIPSAEQLAARRNNSSDGGGGNVGVNPAPLINPPVAFNPPGFNTGFNGAVAGAAIPTESAPTQPMPHTGNSAPFTDLGGSATTSADLTAAMPVTTADTFSTNHAPIHSDPMSMSGAATTTSEPTFPNITPPEIAFNPASSFPSMPQQQLEYYCSKCRKPVPAHVDDFCPHCGAYFSYVETPGGGRKYNGWRWGAGGGLGLLAAVAGVILRLIFGRRE